MYLTPLPNLERGEVTSIKYQESDRVHKKICHARIYAWQKLRSERNIKATEAS